MQSSLIPSYEKVGGWLIYVAIGLIGTIALGVFTVGTTHLPLFVNGTVNTILNAPPGTISPYLFPVFLTEIAGNLFFIIFAGLLLIQMKSRNPRLPRNIIIFYASSLAFIVLDILVYQVISPGQPLDKSDLQTLGRAIMGCAIWIPYFLISKRVKGTFRTQVTFVRDVESQNEAAAQPESIARDDKAE